MKRTNIHLTEDQRGWLKAEFKRTGVRPAENLRRILDAHIRRSRKRDRNDKSSGDSDI